MFKILEKTFRTKTVTVPYPDAPARVSERFRGRPKFDFDSWADARPAAAECPTGAVSASDAGNTRRVTIDYGRCNFCGLCAGAGATMTTEFAMAARSRNALIVTATYALKPDGTHERLTGLADAPDDAAEQLKAGIHEVLGRSLAIREVDAGSCNGCEQEIVALNNPIHDIERLGIHFVASPRHADMLLVTGPVTRNMEQALRKTYDATPEPKVVAAVGACGISGGIFGTNYATTGAVDRVAPVDVYIPGCPPRPQALLHGILLAVGRLGGKRTR